MAGTLKEYWVTKTYRSFNDKEFVFFMGFSCFSAENALRESLGKTNIEDLVITEKTEDRIFAEEVMDSGNISTFLVEQRSGCPEYPKHKNYSYIDFRLPQHIPQRKEIPLKLF